MSEVDKIVEAQTVEDAQPRIAGAHPQRSMAEGLVQRVEAGGSSEVPPLLPIAQVVKLRLNVLKHELQNGERLERVGIDRVLVAICSAL